MANDAFLIHRIDDRVAGSSNTFEKCPLCDSADSATRQRATARATFFTSRNCLKSCAGCAAALASYLRRWLLHSRALRSFFPAQPSQIPGIDIENARSTSARMSRPCANDCPRPAGAARHRLRQRALMTTAAEFGFHPVGLDLRENGVLLMRKFAMKPMPLPSKTIGPASSRFISMADVLEHMAFPKPARDTLELAARRRAPVRLMPMRIPSLEDPQRKRRQSLLGEIEHYHNFGRRRFTSCWRNADSSRSATA